MLKRLLVTLLAIVLTIPVVGIQVSAEELSEEIQIQEVNEEVNNNEIITDDSYNVQVEEEEIVEEVIEENQEEVVIDNDAQVEVEQELEQEITTDEVIEEETTEEVKEVTTDVVDKTLEEEQVEEELKEEEPAPLMLMAAPKMAMLSLGSSRAATNDPTDPENFDIINNYGPVYVTITWTEFIHAEFATNISYNFTENGWEKVVNEFSTVSQAYGYYKLRNNSLNNIYVHMNYTPVVEGTSLKLFQDASFNTNGSLNTNLQNWTVEKCEYRKYDIDGDGLGTRGGDYSSRYISYMKEADIDNQYWCAALSGYGRQKGPAGGNRTQVVPDGMVKYYTSIWNKDYIEVDARDKVCSYMGWWCVRWLSSDGTKSTINTDQLSENGGVLGTVTFRIDEVLENYDQFFTK